MIEGAIVALPFKVKKRVLKIEDVPGLEGAVFVRPWKLFEYEEVLAKRQTVSGEKAGVDLMIDVVANVLCDESGDPVSVAPDQIRQSLDAGTVGYLFQKVVELCGPRAVEEDRKNSSTGPSGG